MLSIPTVFDLVATVLMNVGLLTVTASVYQMMRGAEMLFAALFAVLFLSRRLNRLHFSGIGCCIVGISLVGLSSVLSGEAGTAQPVTQAQIVLGMGLIVLSQAVQVCFSPVSSLSRVTCFLSMTRSVHQTPTRTSSQLTASFFSIARDVLAAGKGEHSSGNCFRVPCATQIQMTFHRSRCMDGIVTARSHGAGGTDHV